MMMKEYKIAVNLAGRLQRYYLFKDERFPIL